MDEKWQTNSIKLSIRELHMQHKISQISYFSQDDNHGFPEMRFGHCMTTTKTGVAIFGGVSLR